MGEGGSDARRGALSALVMSTIAFTVCFAAWVVNAVLVTHLVNSGVYDYDADQVAWLLAVPILVGAVARVPMGMLADRFGGRVVLTANMLAAAVPMYLLSEVDSYAGFFAASLGFGLAGASFAVGVAFVAAWTRPERHGLALGIFGMGNAGAALTTLVAPHLLSSFTESGAEGWRLVPRLYAAVLVITAVAFFASTRDKKTSAPAQGLRERLAPLASPIVWRLGLYYFLVFGGFVSLAQWIIPYGVNVYALSLAQAGLLASVFSLPSGVIRAAGGWLSDRFGARTVSYWVFGSTALACLVLAIPRMDIETPGEGVLAAEAGAITSVTPDAIRVGDRTHAVVARPAELPSETDGGERVLPAVTSWQEPIRDVGDEVAARELLARGVTRILYPANVWVFAALVLVVGITTGVGKASVYKFIPEHFPRSIGAVGGMVGLLGALGGFVLPPVFGALLRWTGFWASCWMVLALLSLACLISMHLVIRRIMAAEVPELAEIMERHPRTALDASIRLDGVASTSLEELLARVPFFDHLSQEELSSLARAGERRTLEASEDVFRQGDPGDALYVVLSGSVRVHHAVDGEDVDIATLPAGRFFGELSLIDGQPRSATVTALEPVELFALDRKSFLERLSRTPHMVADLLIGLSANLRADLARLRPAPAHEPTPAAEP